MRVVLPVAVVAVFATVVRLAWAEVHEAITRSTQNSPYLQPPPAPAPRPPVVEEVEDDRDLRPGEVLPPPPVRPARRTQYADPRAPQPARVHPAERVPTTP